MGIRGSARHLGGELERWVITCTAYGPAGPAVYLATTEDFTTVERYGIMRHPEDKNAALLPHRIDGRWILFHRPKTQFGGAHSEIVLSRSADLDSWSAPEQVLQPREGAWWDSLRIGIGPPPLLDRARLASDLPRRQGDGLRLPLPRRPGAARPRGADPRAAPAPELDPGTDGPVRAHGRRPERRVPLRRRPTTQQRTSSASTMARADTSICLATARLAELVEAVLSAPDEG